MADNYETSQELVARGIPMHAQKAAMAAGDLPFRALGSDSFSYKQVDVIRWLNRDSPSSREARRPSGSAPATAPARQASAPASAPGSPLAEWQSRMAKLCGGGTPPREAVIFLDRVSPGLRQAAVREANKNRRASHRASISEATERRAARSQLS